MPYSIGLDRFRHSYILCVSKLAIANRVMASDFDLWMIYKTHVFNKHLQTALHALMIFKDRSL